VALVMVELTDVVFAVDSIPAILAVTRDPFLVFTSNAFAILGLRSLYFAVAGLMAMFRYLKYSLVAILAFVGVKMLLIDHFHVPNHISLAIILATLVGGIVASVWVTRREAAAENSTAE
jgi:tellurite resistance protein TerC